MKHCGDCDQHLPLAAFAPRKRLGRVIPQPYCRLCMQARWRKWKAAQSDTPKVYRGWPADPFAAWGKPMKLVARI